MRIICILLLAVAGPIAVADDSSPAWNVFTNVDLFAYSEPVSVVRFAKDFDEPLKSGDTAFTHDEIELGVKWKAFRLSFVNRFDYITRFTNDTALVHHSEKNNAALPSNREYALLLDVDRVTAKGIKFGYTWQALPTLSIDVAGSYYSSLKDLQSGFARANGDPQPISDQLITDIQTVLSGISTSNRDLSPLYPLVADVNADILINYAYDEPKFDEPYYRKPTITGTTQNPVISGVDFSAPGGKGYSFDISVSWQATEQLHLGLDVLDLGNKFKWKNAPQTIASFDLNPTLVDAINVSQDFVNGLVVKPNDIVDRHLMVNIFNADFTQKLPVRVRLSGAWQLADEVNLFGWTPTLSILGSYYHTETQSFPRIGVAFNDSLRVEYDIAGKALALGYTHQYFFVKIVTDKFAFKDARTLGLAAGLNYSF